MECKDSYKKRVRKESGKRWTKEDKDLLLSIIAENPIKFEKPTAQTYYSNFIHQYSQFEEYGWKSMRDKIRNLRATYTRAVDWMRSNGSGLNEEDGEESIRAYILKLCEDFDVIDSIFGNKKDISSLTVHESGDIYSTPDTLKTALGDVHSIPSTSKAAFGDVYCIPNTSNTAIDAAEEQPHEEEIIFTNPQDVHFVTESAPPSPSSFPSQRKRSTLHPKSASSYLAEVQKDKTAYLREKLELTRLMEERKLKLMEDKMNADREKMNAEREFAKEQLRLKEYEINKNFQLNESRLEKEMALKEIEINKNFLLNESKLQQEMALKELELKYKYGKE